MDLLTLLFRLPFLPLTSLLKLGEIIRDQAEGELHGTASVRRQLEEIDQAVASGEMSEEEAAEEQQQALDRVMSAPGDQPAPAGGGGPRGPESGPAGGAPEAPVQRRVTRIAR